MSKDFILYGMNASLFTGKARAYMRRNRIPVTERGTGHPEYTGRILPHMNRFIMPVIETPGGDIIQDGTDILDYLEGEGLGREPLYPEDPVIKAISLLFELFGNEGLPVTVRPLGITACSIRSTPIWPAIRSRLI